MNFPIVALGLAEIFLVLYVVLEENEKREVLIEIDKVFVPEEIGINSVEEVQKV